MTGVCLHFAEQVGDFFYRLKSAFHGWMRGFCLLLPSNH